jgi:hypothetical protein
MSETLRELGRGARSLGQRRRPGDGHAHRRLHREGRMGRALIVVGLLLLVVAIVGAIAVNL